MATSKGLDISKLMNADLKLRESEVPVPELAAFFPDGEQPVWVVRQLTASEMNRAQEAGKNEDKIRAVITAMSGDGDKADAIRGILGVGDEETPAEISRRIEMLVHGSVLPKITPEMRDAVVVMAEKFATQFYNLTTKIMSLTGQGAEVGKPKRSTRKAASG